MRSITLDPLRAAEENAKDLLAQLDEMKRTVIDFQASVSHLHQIRALMYSLGGVLEERFDERMTELFPEQAAS